jgi:hypothetical protein
MIRRSDASMIAFGPAFVQVFPKAEPQLAASAPT